MRFSVPALSLFLAASAVAQFDKQSAPFHLVIVSDNKTVDGDTLSSCHEGAAIESLCLSNSNSNSKPQPAPPGIYTFNTSDTQSTSGYLTYELHGGNFNESEALTLSYSPTTNVALPLFFPGAGSSALTVSFDDKDLLNIQSYVDDTVSPPIAGDFKPYYRWYACLTYYSGYQYITLAWIVGNGEPQNPSCVKVGVKRVFTY